MDTRQSGFNRILLIILSLLYVITILAFSYFNWAADPSFTEWWIILLNIPILSIPMGILYGAIYMLVAGWREFSQTGQVNRRLAKIIRWASRIAAIMLLAFIGMFSLDVFEMQGSPLELLGGFLIHNIPSISMLVVLIFAWKRPVIGFVAFLIIAILFTIAFVRNFESLPNLLLFVFPILLIAGLFYADWKWLRPQPPA